MSQNGAAITTLISEAFVFVFCFLRIPSKADYIDFKNLNVTIIHSLIGSAIVVLISFFAKKAITNYLFRIAVIVVLSMVIYSVFLFIINDSYFHGFFAMVKKKIILKTSGFNNKNKGD